MAEAGATIEVVMVPEDCMAAPQMRRLAWRTGLRLPGSVARASRVLNLFDSRPPTNFLHHPLSFNPLTPSTTPYSTADRVFRRLDAAMGATRLAPGERIYLYSHRYTKQVVYSLNHVLKVWPRICMDPASPY
jgi:hypothetical protein